MPPKKLPVSTKQNPDNKKTPRKVFDFLIKFRCLMVQLVIFCYLRITLYSSAVNLLFVVGLLSAKLDGVFSELSPVLLSAIFLLSAFLSSAAPLVIWVCGCPEGERLSVA